MSFGSIVPGACIVLDKRCVAQNTEIGQYLVCVNATKDSADATLKLVGDFCLFSSGETAAAHWKLVSDALNAGNAWDTVDATSSSGYIGSLSVKRQALHYLVTKWQALCDVVPAGGGGAVGDARSAPEIGKTLQFTAPVQDSHGTTVVVSVSGIVNAKDSVNLEVEGVHDGVTFNIVMLPVKVQRLLQIMQAQQPPPVGYPSLFDCTLYGNELFSMLKALPLSSVTGAGMVDVREVVCVLNAFNADTALGQLQGAGSAGDATIVMDAFMGLFDLTQLLQRQGMANRQWPQDSAGKLGDALRLAAIVPVPAASLAESLRNAASQGDFDAFLKDAYRLTVKESMWSWMSLAAASVHMSKLDAFLVKGGARSNAQAIAAFKRDHSVGGGLSLGSLQEFLLEVADGMETLGAGGNASVPNLVPPPPPPPPPVPFMQMGSAPMVLYNQTTSATNTETRTESQLRLDAAEVHRSEKLQRILQAMITLKENQLDGALETMIQSCKEPAVLRLIQFEGNIEQALQGGYSPIAASCSSLRDVLERRLEYHILGDGHAVVPNRQSKAFRMARLGKLKQLRLFHLVDLDDYGTAESPLSQFSKPSSSSVESRCEQLRRAFARLQQILQISFPATQGQCLVFMPKFLERIIDMVRLRVEVCDISEYYQAVVHLVCGHTTRFSSGEASTPDLLYDISWLGAARDHNERFQLAAMKSLARQEGGSSSKGGAVGGGGG
jgi:hypothetical protein